jgi:choline transport protein
VAFNQILSLGLSALLSSYAISIGCITLQRLRGQTLLKSEFSLGVWGLPINLGAMAFILVAWVMAYFPGAANPTTQTMNWACMVYGIVLGVAALYYYFTGRHHYVGPVAYVKKDL